VGNRSFCLLGSQGGLGVVDDFGSPVATLAGPSADPPPSGLQRDVEGFGGFAYLCSNTLGPREGLMVVDLRKLGQNPPALEYLRSVTPADGNPRATNLSIDATSGHLYLQRAAGVEVWSLRSDPAQPVYLGTFAQGVPVSDLVVQGGRAYLAEGSSASFSIWSVADPSHPALLHRMAAKGFARSIWPDESGDIFGTVEESPQQAVRFWTLSPSAGALLRGSWSFGNGNAPSSIKLAKGSAYLAHGAEGLLVLSLADPSKPTLAARYDGPMPGGEPAYREVWDVLPPFHPGGPLLFSDRKKGLAAVQVY
jgi:hypothetical protein